MEIELQCGDASAWPSVTINNIGPTVYEEPQIIILNIKRIIKQSKK